MGYENIYCLEVYFDYKFEVICEFIFKVVLVKKHLDTLSSCFDRQLISVTFPSAPSFGAIRKRVILELNVLMCIIVIIYLTLIYCCFALKPRQNVSPICLHVLIKYRHLYVLVFLAERQDYLQRP